MFTLHGLGFGSLFRSESVYGNLNKPLDVNIDGNANVCV